MSIQTYNVVCLHCRRAANRLPCQHTKIRIHNDRAPKQTASDKEWEKFVTYLNTKYWFEHYESEKNDGFRAVKTAIVFLPRG